MSQENEERRPQAGDVILIKSTRRSEGIVYYVYLIRAIHPTNLRAHAFVRSTKVEKRAWEYVDQLKKLPGHIYRADSARHTASWTISSELGWPAVESLFLRPTYFSNIGDWNELLHWSNGLRSSEEAVFSPPILPEI